MVSADAAALRELARLVPPDEYALRLAVDTNTLIDNPDLAAHASTLGGKYMVHLLPVVLREIDDIKADSTGMIAYSTVAYSPRRSWPESEWLVRRAAS